MSLIVPRPDNLPFSITPIGLEAVPEATFDDWKDFGKLLKGIDTARQWIIGDWLNTGEARWGEKYKDALLETDYEYQTLADYAWVCSKVSFSIRNRNLSFAHHRVIAPLPPDEQVHWLNLAQEKGWDDAELRQAITPKDPPAYPAYGLLKRKLRMFEQLRRDDLKTEDRDERKLMLDLINDHLKTVDSLRKDLENNS